MTNLYDLNNQELFEFGQKLTRKFLAVNGLPPPGIIRDRSLGVKPKGSYGCGVCIYPREPERGTKIVVFAAACARPSVGYAMKWSFPGYVIDRTPVGVLSHEIGHHCDFVLGVPSKDMPKKGRKVSGYEPNSMEMWAESMRLFILNPDLLSRYSPERYEYIRNVVGLKPATKRDAIARLDRWGASEAILEMCAKKIA